MTRTILFDPLLPWPVIWVAAVLALLFVGVALWRGLSGWWLRGLALAVLLGALANPALQTEEREGLSDIVLLVVDETASQSARARPGQVAEAIARVEAEVAGLDDTELRIHRLSDAEENRGTLLMGALQDAMAEIPRARLAGAILLTDGRLHDIGAATALPAPLHVLLTGRPGDWDRRLIVKNAPAFAITGEEITLTLRIEDQGDAPRATETEIAISADGNPPRRFRVPIGEDLDLPVTLPHGGMNVLRFELPEAEGELTTRNNAAVVQINGVRDRLRVLLVSGEPHAGERTWRNLLKSDASVDLVHFTILRPPEKQDGVPVSELSLIAFPTRELFLDKIDEFDLIIFDRYKRRGILPSLYLDNVRAYVEAGGALLVAAGPDYASADSIYRSPLSTILPGEPTGRVLEEPFLPVVTEIGQRHPVTTALSPDPDAPDWGRWLRQIEVTPARGTVAMEGIDGRPLLLLDRVGEGRVALLASDHAWLWSRGYEGGGPQLELLRRLAHWMMGEPELEEETLTADAIGQGMTIIRRTMSERAAPVTVTGPDGTRTVVELTEVRPGAYQGRFEGPEIGLYRLEDGTLETVIGLGPAAPREFEQTIATDEIMAPAIDARRGGSVALEDGVPSLRSVREGRPAAGRGWIGLTPREAYETLDIRQSALLPPWLVLLIASGLILGGWLREGRR